MPTVLVTGSYYYAELAVSSPAVAETIASIYSTYTHEGMARLSGGPECMAWTRRRWSPISALTGFDVA